MGQAIYTGINQGTVYFTTSTTPLTNNTIGATGSGVAGSLTGTVSLLTLQNSTFVDNSGYNYIISYPSTSYPRTTTVTPFTSVATPLSWTQLAAGDSNVFVIRSDGGLFSWGNNNYGQLGLNNTISTSYPLQVGTSSWTAVRTEGYAVIAQRVDGTLFAWGYNGAGQLGLYHNYNLSSPTQISTTTSYIFAATVVDQSAGYFTTSDYTTYYTGSPYGVTAAQSSPTQIGFYQDFTMTPYKVGTSSWTSVSAGKMHIVAIKADGTLWAWGNNTLGQLGDSTTVTRSSITQISTSSWSAVSAGGSHTCLLYTSPSPRD